MKIKHDRLEYLKICLEAVGIRRYVLWQARTLGAVPILRTLSSLSALCALALSLVRALKGR